MAKLRREPRYTLWGAQYSPPVAWLRPQCAGEQGWVVLSLSHNESLRCWHDQSPVPAAGTATPAKLKRSDLQGG